MEFPSGALSLQSPFYIERPSVEALCYQNIEVPGSLTRIKGSRQMGKSSLLVRLLAQARNVGCQTVLIDFRMAEDSIYSDLPRFLRWFCSVVANQLNLPTNLDDYWDEDVGAKLSTADYFEDYLLEAADTPIVLALDEVNRVFEHPNVAGDFLPLLRFWHEQAKHNVTLGKLRTVIVHSTDISVPLSVHQSPFNIGLPIQLKPFNDEQALQLARQYGVAIQEAPERRSLMNLVGGHPHLLSIAFYHLMQSRMSLSQLVAEASSADGAYGQHLQTCLEALQQQPVLIEVLEKVVTALDPVKVAPVQAHQLANLGLVVLEGDRCRLACELYRSFFTQQRSSTPLQQRKFQQLKSENARLKTLANMDGLTHLYNRRAFDSRLMKAWKKSRESGSTLSLVLLDIDYFKLYNDTYGHIAGDFCLRQIADVLQGRIRRGSDTVARYGGEEFAVILPETDGLAATQIANQLCDGIRSLTIAHATSLVPSQLVTASIGVASTIPDTPAFVDCQSPLRLIEAADAALYVSKQQGRDRCTASQSSNDTVHLDYSRKERYFKKVG